MLNWIRQEARLLFQKNVDVGVEAFTAMERCDQINLFLPTEVWWEICSWLHVNKLLQKMHVNFHAIRVCSNGPITRLPKLIAESHYHCIRLGHLDKHLDVVDKLNFGQCLLKYFQ